jgi:hypothetical protein
MQQLGAKQCQHGAPAVVWFVQSQHQLVLMAQAS